MKVTVFAVLKDYMPAEFELDTSSIATIGAVRDLLKRTYPAAAAVLESCRFSTDTEILSSDQRISAYEYLFVIPPSSGG